MGIFSNKYVPHISKEVVINKDKVGWEIVTKDNYGFVGMIADKFVFDINDIRALEFDKNGLTDGGFITQSQVNNWDSAYIHSQSGHAPASAEQNVQADWNEANSASDAYIKNKPDITGGVTQRVGSESVSSGNTLITFATALPSSNYALFLYVYDSQGQIGHTISNQTASGFTIGVSAAASVNYNAILLS